jgi:hypothetical protein
MTGEGKALAEKVSIENSARSAAGILPLADSGAVSSAFGCGRPGACSGRYP